MMKRWRMKKKTAQNTQTQTQNTCKWTENKKNNKNIKRYTKDYLRVEWLLNFQIKKKTKSKRFFEINDLLKWKAIIICWICFFSSLSLSNQKVKRNFIKKEYRTYLKWLRHCGTRTNQNEFFFLFLWFFYFISGNYPFVVVHFFAFLMPVQELKAHSSTK